MAVTAGPANIVDSPPWKGRDESLAYLEVMVPAGEKTIEVNFPAGVLAYVVWPDGVDGTVMAVKPKFPWSAGDAYVASPVTIDKPATTPGFSEPLEYNTWKGLMGGFQLELDVEQTSDVVFGLVFWHS